MLVALVHRDRSVGPSVAVCACACVGGVRGQSRRGRNGRRVLRAPRSPEMELAMRVVAACVVACEMGMETKAAIGSDRSVHRTSLALIEMHCGACLGVLASSRHDEKERSRLEARPPRRRSARKKQPACSLLSPLADAAFLDIADTDDERAHFHGPFSRAKRFTFRNFFSFGVLHTTKNQFRI